jgi:hypothetical protein
VATGIFAERHAELARHAAKPGLPDVLNSIDRNSKVFMRRSPFKDLQ